jgi:exodeoxyribonuclease VII large subunit
MKNQKNITLSQLNGKIRESFEMSFPNEIWLVAEIAEMRIAGAGHCYMDLVEKNGDRILARMRANIWKFQYERIAGNFFTATGNTLQRGLKVLLSVSVSFHEQYGVSLVVKNIDANYSLGDLERRKKEIIAKLVSQNLINKNSNLELELVPKRIAVISSETAAGYGDFISQLTNNSNSYVFECKLFPSTMQGENVASSVVKSLNIISNQNFDCVVIIRGGGANLDLAGFDNFELGKAIANFKIPVLTGIGHERDETIPDLVAHTKLKTPTAVAEFLIDKMSSFEEYFTGLKEALLYFTREKVVQNKIVLRQLSHLTKTGTQKELEKNRKRLIEIKSELPRIANAFLKSKQKKMMWSTQGILILKTKILGDQNQKLILLKSVLKVVTNQKIKNENLRLSLIENTINLVHPSNVLKRGYALIINEGKVIKSTKQLIAGLEVRIKLKDGVKKSKISE